MPCKAIVLRISKSTTIYIHQPGMHRFGPIPKIMPGYTDIGVRHTNMGTNEDLPFSVLLPASFWTATVLPASIEPLQVIKI